MKLSKLDHPLPLWCGKFYIQLRWIIDLFLLCWPRYKGMIYQGKIWNRNKKVIWKGYYIYMEKEREVGRTEPIYYGIESWNQLHYGISVCSLDRLLHNILLRCSPFPNPMWTRDTSCTQRRIQDIYTTEAQLYFLSVPLKGF